jgi:hypothetical protein
MVLSEVSGSLATMTNLTNVPAPLGYCAKCTAQGTRTQATTFFEGTGSCDGCTIGSYAVADPVHVQHLLRLADDGPGQPQVF